jgi:hypothetical protein
MNKRSLDIAFIAICLLWAVTVMPRMATGRWSPEAEMLLVWVGGILRLAFLLVAAVAGVRGLQYLESSNPARNSQAFLAGGFTAYLIAQTALFVLSIASGGIPPYPSAADIGFFVAMFLMIAGVALAIRAWLSLGLFPDGVRRAATAAIVAAVPLAVGVIVTIRSLASADVPVLQTAADMAYPILDSTLIILTVAMLRLTLLLGKGSVGLVWRSLLAGFLAMAAGDVVYSFFAGFNLDALDPVLDVLYTVSYALLARGALLQLRLLKS